MSPTVARMRQAPFQRIAGSYVSNRFMSTPSGGNPKVFFECEVGGKPIGRITFELFSDTVPKVQNFKLFVYSRSHLPLIVTDG
jgi:hypothetical protein